VSAARHERNNDEVEQLLLNAQLRDELEPFLDESVEAVNTHQMPTHEENKYLASMLDWERAPVLPICRWFAPELSTPHPDSLNDEQLTYELTRVIEALYHKQIVLDYTDHLSDRELYRLVYRDILPAREKMIDRKDTLLHWQCIDVNQDPEIWLRYYATQSEREAWEDEVGGILPPSEPPPYRRRMPPGHFA